LVIQELGKQFRDDEKGMAGLEEIEEVIRHLHDFGVPPEHYSFDLHLARGLDYYTGPIFETVLPDHPHIGSLTGGGRYDELIGRFSGIDVPATGTTIGLDRIFTAMQQLGMLDCVKTKSQVLVTLFNKETIQHSLHIASELRENGINAELFFETEGLKKQLTYAQRKGIPFVVIPGPDELQRNEVSVKNMESGQQSTVSRDSLAAYVKDHFKTCLPTSPSP
jgi:histidyl-tRNA synthetase